MISNRKNAGPMTNNDDLMIEDDIGGKESPDDNPWKILIADDDEQVHHATRLVLGNMQFESKPAVFFSTYTAKETCEFLHKKQ